MFLIWSASTEAHRGARRDRREKKPTQPDGITVAADSGHSPVKRTAAVTDGGYGNASFEFFVLFRLRGVHSRFGGGLVVKRQTHDRPAPLVSDGGLGAWCHIGTPGAGKCP